MNYIFCVCGIFCVLLYFCVFIAYSYSYSNDGCIYAEALAAPDLAKCGLMYF